MSRLELIISQSDQPSTVTTLAADLSALGVSAGMTLVVHSSLSAIGYVVGGAVATILALEQAVGPAGTLAVPTHSADLSDPAQWRDPPVPDEWCAIIRAEMPAFDPSLTPSRGMGAIPECLRKQQGSRRSDHPFVSWTARGPNAETITAAHSLEMSAGEGSPLGRLYDCDAYVLLLGVGFDCSTCYHLAEYRCRFAPLKRCTRSAPVLEGGRRKWVEFEDIYWFDDFAEIGSEFEKIGGPLTRGTVGKADSRLFSLRRAVDFAVDWMNCNRRLD